MSDAFKFTISHATNGEEWSPQRISKLLAAIGIIGEGLVVAESGQDYFAQLVERSPQLVTIPEFRDALDYLANQAHGPYPESADPRGQVLARGYLHMSPGEESVQLTSLKKGSIEGVITDVGKTIASGIGWLFSVALDPSEYTWQVHSAFGLLPHGRNRRVAMGAIFEGRRMIAEAVDGPAATIVVTPGIPSQ
jgi:hypothetical protein